MREGCNQYKNMSGDARHLQYRCSCVNSVKKTKLDCLKRTNHSDSDRNKRTMHLGTYFITRIHNIKCVPILRFGIHDLLDCFKCAIYNLFSSKL